MVPHEVKLVWRGKIHRMNIWNNHGSNSTLCRWTDSTLYLNSSTRGILHRHPHNSSHNSPKCKAKSKKDEARNHHCHCSCPLHRLCQRWGERIVGFIFMHFWGDSDSCHISYCQIYPNLLLSRFCCWLLFVLMCLHPNEYSITRELATSRREKENATSRVCTTSSRPRLS